MLKKTPNTSPLPPLFTELSIENRKHISEELFEKLRDAILGGDIPTGYVFPNENELCQKLNMGRGSLREAYSRLETLHLITRTKAGTYVNDQSEFQNSMNFAAIAQRTDAQNLAEYRQIVEVGAAQLAAQKAVDSDIATLESIFSHMERSGDDHIKLSQLDFDFHLSLVRITGNELLVIMFNTVRSIYEDYTESVFEKGYFEASRIDHQAIIDSIKARDPELAGLTMRQHLQHVESMGHLL